LTYNATIDILKERLAEGKLAQFAPTVRAGQAVRRGLYLTPGLSSWLDEKTYKEKETEYRQFVRQKLALFALGQRVDNRFYMKRLKGIPRDIWAIRFNEIEPKTRMFGAFVAPDALFVFIDD
jgi:hypothetical protein